MDYYEDRSGQLNIDVTLDSERSLKDNLQKVVKFTYGKRRLEAIETGWPLRKVSNKHEGYGIVAEAYTKIQAKEKILKGGMADYLNLLQVKGEDAVQTCGSIYSQALELAIEAVGLAADCTRIIDDLNYDGRGLTPLEQLAQENEAAEEEDPETEDGYEDADPAEAEEG